MTQTVRRRGRPKSDQAGSSIQALDRALDVLEALAAHEGITLSALAEHLEQSAATMHRVLATLERRRYAESDSTRQEWFVGPEAFRLGSAFLRRAEIVSRSRAVMRDLMARTGETANLGIERDGYALFISQVETSATIRAFFPPGARSPLHASGVGKALLGAFDEERLVAFLKTARLDRFTDKTIVDRHRLEEEIREIRQRGYAVDDEETTIGMRCVAAPILDGHGEAVAGVSVSGPAVRMPEMKIREFGKLVVEAAQEISRRLGAR